jgi:ParB-like chromosome segregation protein Spo0J
MLVISPMTMTMIVSMTTEVTMKKLKAHAYADLMPMMSEQEMEGLTADIAANGLKQPIVLYQGMILDGRNREMACAKASIEPSYVEHEGDDASALALVISLNIERRHLTSAQRAVTAAQMWLKNGDTKHGGKREAGKFSSGTCKELAKQFHTGTTQITQARELLVEAPDLAAQVAGRGLSLTEASDTLYARYQEAARVAKENETIAKYAEAISSGEMTREQAVRKALEEKMKQEALAEGTQMWLERLARVCEDIEEYVATRTDEELAYYTKPETPGQFDHGITVERIERICEQLQRAKTITFGDFHEKQRAAGKRGQAGNGRTGGPRRRKDAATTAAAGRAAARPETTAPADGPGEGRE